MIDILLPVGRLVQGDLYKGQTTDKNGKPLTTKNGDPRTSFFFAVAIPKKPGETHWSHTAWGQLLYQAGVTGFPAGEHSRPNFSWKVVDGDSAVPDEYGKVWNTKEGFPGHWVVKCGGGFAVGVVENKSPWSALPAGMVKRGYFIEVKININPNGDAMKPGVYINPEMVAFVGYGEEIKGGPDASAMGFGQAELPAGVSAAPIGGMAAMPATPSASPAAAMPAPAQPNNMPPVAQVAPAMPATPVAVQAGPAHNVMGVPAAAAPAPLPVAAPVAAAPAPNPAILGTPAAAPVAPQKVMLPAANGATYEQMAAQGWTDEQLIQHQMMAG